MVGVERVLVLPALTGWGRARLFWNLTRPYPNQNHYYRETQAGWDKYALVGVERVLETGWGTARLVGVCSVWLG